MPAKTKILDSGAEISSDDFGKIFGGGQKKAANAIRRIKIDGEVFAFKIADMAPLQAIIDRLVEENKSMRAKLAELRERQRIVKEQRAAMNTNKRRIRVRANSRQLQEAA